MRAFSSSLISDHLTRDFVYVGARNYPFVKEKVFLFLSFGGFCGKSPSDPGFGEEEQ